MKSSPMGCLVMIKFVNSAERTCTNLVAAGLNRATSEPTGGDREPTGGDRVNLKGISMSLTRSPPIGSPRCTIV